MSVWKWSRLCSLKFEDVWEERLRYLGSALVCFRPANARFLRYETYLTNQVAAMDLKKRFGGTITLVKNKTLVTLQTLSKPQRIRNRLIIDPHPQASPDMPVEKRLHLPAGMAFGTGEHATTATCLRMLCDVLPSLPRLWEMLDLGTGSGILGLAGSRLGARHVAAFDNDPTCVRIAKENAKLNHIKNMTVRKVDVLTWYPTKSVGVVTANLYSEILIKAAPQIVAAIHPGGYLIFSGVLKSQYLECMKVFESLGLQVEPPRVKGKWTAGFARRLANG